MGSNREDNQHEDIATRALYKAAVAGLVPSLEKLIQRDPLILNKLSLTHFSETPLHISALLGHLDFTEALVTYNPRLATIKDSFRRTPLLFASAEGHKETVQALLKAYPNACLVRDQDGKIPLHYAAMRGHVEVLAELMRAKPESVTFRVLDRDTVFHLCVTYNQLECLKLLVEVVRDDEDILNARAGYDHGGLTILESAVMLRQIETIKYLLSVPSVRAEGDDEVHVKVLNMLENSPRDFVTLEIQRVFMDAGLMMRNGSKENEQLPLQNNKSKKDGKKRRKSSIKMNEKCSKAGNWVEEKRGMLMVVAAMITTMTFQATINPPGGFWSEPNTNVTYFHGPVCNVTNPCVRVAVAGTAILGFMNPIDFNSFQFYNIACFLFSTSITLLLVCGFPLRKQLLVRLMSITMSLTLIFLTLTFREGARLLLPSSRTTFLMLGDIILLWLPLFGLVVLIHTFRLLKWLVKKLWRLIHPKNKMTINNNAKAHQLIPINSHKMIISCV